MTTRYNQEESRPDNHYHFFSYQVSITNSGKAPAQLMSRHWIITDAHGRTEEVRGPGVIGQQPEIQPQETFQYESNCPLTTPVGSMKGTYQMQTASGEPFLVEIEEFYLVAPQALH